MLTTQILALTLIPFLSGALTTDRGEVLAPLTILGIEEKVSADFLVGTWKCTDEYHRWGVTDRGEAHIGRFASNSLMTLNADGTAEMVNFLMPEKGRWRLTENGLEVYDPRSLKRSPQLIPVRKSGKDRIWLMLPFAGGAVGLGMSRVPDREVLEEKARAAKKPLLQRSRTSGPSTARHDHIRITDVDVSGETSEPSDPPVGSYPHSKDNY